MNNKLPSTTHRSVLTAQRLPLTAYRSSPGFTLIEILIYSAILAMMMAFTMTTAYSFIDNASRSQKQAALIEQQDFIAYKLQWLLRGVTTINTPSVGATSPTLSIDKLNNPQNPWVLDLQNGVLRLSRAGASAVPLTNSHITASNLSFTHIVSGTTATIRITATLANATGSVPLQTTITIH